MTSLEVALNAIFAMGLVGVGTNRAYHLNAQETCDLLPRAQLAIRRVWFV